MLDLALATAVDHPRRGAIPVPLRLAVSFLVLSLTAWAMPAWAFLDPPYITPADPAADDLISVSIYGGECDVVDDGITWPPPVTRQGSEITIHFTGIHEEDPEFCYYGIGTATYSVGTYPLGSYTLHVERRYGTFNGWVTETLGVIPFTVTGTPPAQPIPTPTLSVTGLESLLLMLVGAASIGLRHRARPRC